MTEFSDIVQSKILEKPSTDKKWDQKIFFNWIILSVITLCVMAYISINENFLTISGIDHFYLEMLSVLLSSIVGYVGISRAIVLNDKLSLFLGLGFFSAAMIDFLHAFFSILNLEQNAFAAHFIPQTWVIGRIVMAIIMMIGLTLFSKFTINKNSIKKLTFIYGFSLGVFSLLATGLSIIQPLPFLTIDFPIKRPYEWISLAFFLTSLLHCYKNQLHLINDNFYKGIILFVFIEIFVNFIISYSASLFDTAFSMAHILKIASFFVLILFISSSISQKHKIQLKLTSDLLNAYNKMSEKIRLEMELKKLKEHEKLKDEFSAMVAHELRTPLTPILVHIDYLKNPKICDNLNKNQLEAINAIESNSQRLEKLIADILTVNKLAMQKMKFEKSTFDVKLFMEGITKDLELFIKQKQIKFVNKTIESFSLITDKERIRQVFDNLITNASDFVSPQSGMIEIGARREDNSAIFYVKDNGIGIPKEKQNDLFKKFYQVNTSITRKHNGTGLGLVICKGIIEGLGGRIWLDSEEGKGTTFYFSIPSDHKMTREANLHELKQEIIIN